MAGKVAKKISENLRKKTDKLKRKMNEKKTWKK